MGSALFRRWLSLVVISVGALAASGMPAGADHESDPRTRNIHPLGHIEESRSLIRAGADPNIHTDIAFWGQHAFQGSWLGFNIRDISAPGNPRHVSSTECSGNQGDVVVWDNVLVRSWNTPAGTPGPFGAGLTCDGQPVPAGFEGVHVFDISDLGNPRLVASVETECGSHTATAVPDPGNGRLLVYSSAVDVACPGFDIIEVPLDDPAGSLLLREVPGEMMCHDIGVIMGDAMKAACAGHHGPQVYGIGGDSGGTLDDPVLLWHREIPGVDPGHSAAWTWDGEVLVFGWEPGGGVQARCQATSTDLERSLFFFDADGNELGRFVFTRFQGPTENCTLHNYNVVPTRSGRDVLVHGSYQSGTGVIDFTDPSNPTEIAWSDPPPLPTVPEFPVFCDPDGPGGQPAFGCEIGGAWSSYWYNGFIYETNITEGLNIFRFSGSETSGAMRLDHLNPQTQEFTIG
jgi:LVIVD repeat